MFLLIIGSLVCPSVRYIGYVDFGWKLTALVIADGQPRFQKYGVSDDDGNAAVQPAKAHPSIDADAYEQWKDDLMAVAGEGVEIAVVVDIAEDVERRGGAGAAVGRRADGVRRSGDVRRQAPARGHRGRRSSPSCGAVSPTSVG